MKNLEWREWYFTAVSKGPTIFELVERGDGKFFCVQYATIEKSDKKITLVWYEGPQRYRRVFRSLKQAKAVGLIEARFRLASKKEPL